MMRSKNTSIVPYAPWTFYRYLLSEISVYFLLSLLFFGFILASSGMIRFLDLIIGSGISLESVLRICEYLTISILQFVVPVSFFLSILVSLGYLSANSEIIAMRSLGFSLYRLYIPVLALGVALFFLSLALNFYIVPWGKRMVYQEVAQVSNNKAVDFIQEKSFTREFFNKTLYVNKLGLNGKDLEGVFIYSEQKGGLSSVLIAQRGEILKNTERNSGLMLRLFDGNLYRSWTDKPDHELIYFSNYDIILRLDSGIRFADIKKVKAMDHNDLKREIAALERAPQNQLRRIKDLKVEFWKRYALAVTCILLAITGVGFGVLQTRAVHSSSFMVCLLFIFIYWFFDRMSVYFVEEDILSPFFSVWLGNFILMGAAIFSVYRLRSV